MIVRCTVWQQCCDMRSHHHPLAWPVLPGEDSMPGTSALLPRCAEVRRDVCARCAWPPTSGGAGSWPGGGRGSVYTHFGAPCSGRPLGQKQVGVPAFVAWGPCLPQCMNERSLCARPRPSLAAYVGPRADCWLLSNLDAPVAPGFTSCCRKPLPPQLWFFQSSAVRGPLSFLSSTRVWRGSVRRLPHGPRTGAPARTACGAGGQAHRWSVVRLPPSARWGQLPALTEAELFSRGLGWGSSHVMPRRRGSPAGGLHHFLSPVSPRGCHVSNIKEED